jgi:hypothetical protein
MRRCTDNPPVVFPKVFWHELTRLAYVFIYWMALQTRYILFTSLSAGYNMHLQSGPILNFR